MISALYLQSSVPQAGRRCRLSGK